MPYLKCRYIIKHARLKNRITYRLLWLFLILKIAMCSWFKSYEFFQIYSEIKCPAVSSKRQGHLSGKFLGTNKQKASLGYLRCSSCQSAGSKNYKSRLMSLRTAHAQLHWPDAVLLIAWENRVKLQGFRRREDFSLNRHMRYDILDWYVDMFSMVIGVR